MSVANKITAKPDKVSVHPVTGESIAYYDAEHAYFLNNDFNQRMVSTTQLLDPYFPKFDSEKIAWFVARKQGRPVSEILAEWEQKRNDGAARGTIVHKIAETILKFPKEIQKVIATGGLKEEDLPFLKCLERTIPTLLERYEFIDNEMIVFNPEHMICGTIDLLMRCKRTGAVIIFDWKTNKKISMKGKNGSLAAPLKHLDGTDYTKYALQLGVYRRLIEIGGYFPGAKTHSSILHLRRDLKTGSVVLKTIAVDALDREIDELFALRKLKLTDQDSADSGFDY